MGLREFESELTGAVERLRPSVVRIRVDGGHRGRHAAGAEAAGTGVIVDSGGILVTNRHVVHDAGTFRALLDDGRELAATTIAEDRATDVAVVRVDGRGLPAAQLANSEELRVGQIALAIGNSLGLPGGPTVSVGVISALHRPLPGADYVLEGLVQTDAAINPGNSGGPLADLDGRVVGLNTAVVPYAQGVGFAIPSNTVRYVLDQVLESGRVVRPWLGISAVGVDDALARRLRLKAARGVYLADVVMGSPAGIAGLRSGDVVVRIGPYEVAGLRELLRALSRLPIGGAVDVECLRGGATRRVVLRIAETPADLVAE